MTENVFNEAKEIKHCETKAKRSFIWARFLDNKRESIIERLWKMKT